MSIFMKLNLRNIFYLINWTNAAKTQRTVERRSRKDDSQTLQRRNLRKRITNKVKHEYNTHEYYTRVSLYYKRFVLNSLIHALTLQ